MSSYRLTARAEADIFDVFLQGIERFGRNQALRYKDDLSRCFRLLAESPRMGRAAESIAEGVRRHEHGSHVIFYEITDDGVLILAVVHGRSVRKLGL